MFINYKDKVITSILSIIPKNKIFFEKNINNYNFSKNQSLKLKKLWVSIPGTLLVKKQQYQICLFTALIIF